MSGPINLTMFRAHGIVTKHHPLSAHPIELTMFGDPQNPTLVDLLVKAEVDAMLGTLARHARTLARFLEPVEPVNGHGAEPTQGVPEAVAFLREMFPEPKPVIVVPSSVQ